MDSHAKAIIHGSGRSDYRTPPDLYEKLAGTFPFDVDLASDATNHCCDYWFGPGSPVHQDALAAWWSGLFSSAAIGFLNPPYSLQEIRELRKAGVADTDPRIRAFRIEEWARKAFVESERGFTTVGLFPYAPQTEWFRLYVMGHTLDGNGWRGHAALDFWRIPHRVSFLSATGEALSNAGVNSCIVIWGPNPGFAGPWVPSGRYWSYR